MNAIYEPVNKQAAMALSTKEPESPHIETVEEGLKYLAEIMLGTETAYLVRKNLVAGMNVTYRLEISERPLKGVEMHLVCEVQPRKRPVGRRLISLK